MGSFGSVQKKVVGEGIGVPQGGRIRMPMRDTVEGRCLDSRLRGNDGGRDALCHRGNDGEGISV